MQLQGITIDFNDKKTCGLLPSLCLQWDEKSEELEDNEELTSYWKNNLEKVLEKTQNIVTGNVGTRSILYSADPEAIEIIKDAFNELKLDTIEYEEIMKCENCLEYDYLDKNFNK